MRQSQAFVPKDGTNQSLFCILKRTTLDGVATTEQRARSIRTLLTVDLAYLRAAQGSRITNLMHAELIPVGRLPSQLGPCLVALP